MPLRFDTTPLPMIYDMSAIHALLDSAFIELIDLFLLPPFHYAAAAILRFLHTPI